jgi:hypothetical protein
MGWGVPGKPPPPTPKKKKKKKILHGMAIAKLSFKPPKNIFLIKFSPLKCFSLKIHENSHDYALRPAIKSKDFREIKGFQKNAKNERLKKVKSFTKLHTRFH